MTHCSISRRQWLGAAGALSAAAALAPHARAESPAKTDPKAKAEPPVAADSVLLFTSFRQNGQDGLHLAWSEDGYTWTDLGKPFLAPKVGQSKLMRDPCIQAGPDGFYHMVWTPGWRERGIGYACSKDLRHWSEQQYIPVMAHEPKAQNAWAPELTYDAAGKRWLIYWATTIPGRFPKTDGGKHHNHRMYCCTTRDFRTFTKAKLFFDPGYNVIDATIVPRGAKDFVLVFKDERIGKKVLKLAYAARPRGPYTKIADKPFTTDWVEGPSVIRIGEEWFVYFDHYASPHYYGAVKTRDFRTWTDVSKQMHFPPGHRHGTVFRVPRSLLEGLKRR